MNDDDYMLKAQDDALRRYRRAHALHPNDPAYEDDDNMNKLDQEDCQAVVPSTFPVGHV